jgi:hypothetical protein
MTSKQLVKALLNLHPDYQDSEMLVMFTNEKGDVDYQTLAFTGIVMVDEHSGVVLGTETVAIKMTEEGKARYYHNNKTVTKEDLDNHRNKE